MPKRNQGDLSLVEFKAALAENGLPNLGALMADFTWIRSRASEDDVRADQIIKTARLLGKLGLYETALEIWQLRGAEPDRQRSKPYDFLDS